MRLTMDIMVFSEGDKSKSEARGAYTGHLSAPDLSEALSGCRYRRFWSGVVLNTVGLRLKLLARKIEAVATLAPEFSRVAPGAA
jgi:hypothetical protein